MSSSAYQPRLFIRRVERKRLTPEILAAHALGAALFGPVCAAGAAVLRTPGMAFHLEALELAARLVARGGRTALAQATKLVVFPMDSTRYFEFDWVWSRLAQVRPGADYLDVSSPRLLPLRFARHNGVRRALLVNPDANDLKITGECVSAWRITSKCRTLQQPIEQVELDRDRFDVVTSISVLEHILDDEAALRRMWELVKPGGRLLLTLPCAAHGYDQYRAFNEYNLAEARPDGSYFFQRFYDEQTLTRRVYRHVGQPVTSAVYGERTPGFFGRNAERKMRGLPYPFWNEPLMMRAHFACFPAIDRLPGEGVVALEFVKARG